MYYLEKEDSSFSSQLRKIVLIRRRVYYIWLQNDCFCQQSHLFTRTTCFSLSSTDNLHLENFHLVKREWLPAIARFLLCVHLVHQISGLFLLPQRVKLTLVVGIVWLDKPVPKGKIKSIMHRILAMMRRNHKGFRAFWGTESPILRQKSKVSTSGNFPGTGVRMEVENKYR